MQLIYMYFFMRQYRFKIMIFSQIGVIKYKIKKRKCLYFLVSCYKNCAACSAKSSPFNQGKKFTRNNIKRRDSMATPTK